MIWESLDPAKQFNMLQCSHLLPKYVELGTDSAHFSNLHQINSNILAFHSDFPFGLRDSADQDIDES